MPQGVAINDVFAYVDFKLIGMKEPEIKSVYNRKNAITYMLNKQTGEVAIDYAMDINTFIKNNALENSLQPGQDLRQILVDKSYFVPIRSVSYVWKDNQPMPQN
jgi:hypothetical protein